MNTPTAAFGRRRVERVARVLTEVDRAGTAAAAILRLAAVVVVEADFERMAPVTLVLVIVRSCVRL
jgi:hypothetical protein